MARRKWPESPQKKNPQKPVQNLNFQQKPQKTKPMFPLKLRHLAFSACGWLSQDHRRIRTFLVGIFHGAEYLPGLKSMMALRQVNSVWSRRSAEIFPTTSRSCRASARRPPCSAAGARESRTKATAMTSFLSSFEATHTRIFS